MVEAISSQGIQSRVDLQQGDRHSRERFLSLNRPTQEAILSALRQISGIGDIITSYDVEQITKEIISRYEGPAPLNLGTFVGQIQRITRYMDDSVDLNHTQQEITILESLMVNK